MDDKIENFIESIIGRQLFPSHPQKHHRRYRARDREGSHNKLYAEYFADDPVFSPKQFRRRYRMRKHLFEHIMHTLGDWSPYFSQRYDAFGKKGFSSLQKCIAAMRMFACGVPADYIDDTLSMAETTSLECLREFAKGIRENFGEVYLRRPTEEDVQRLLHIGEARGFPGMLGSIDCMHWEWKNCPVPWKAQFTRGDYGVPTIMLEAVASHDLWIWHAYFGVSGCNNDINVLNQSPVFTQVLQGRAPEVQFAVNGNDYDMGYYLADGIYPEWATFVKTIRLPPTEKTKLFAKMQEGARKDVERAFGVLQSRFAIVRGPVNLWYRQDIADIMYACVILHNMLVEDERDSYEVRFDYDYDQGTFNNEIDNLNHGPIHEFTRVLEIGSAIRDRATHRQLKGDLKEHLWQRFGGGQP